MSLITSTEMLSKEKGAKNFITGYAYLISLYLLLIRNPTTEVAIGYRGCGSFPSTETHIKRKTTQAQNISFLLSQVKSGLLFQ